MKLKKNIIQVNKKIILFKTPAKKNKQRELTKKQKEQNRNLSSQRIFVEHLIRVVKIFKVSQERFRLKKDRSNSILLTICGLVRLRLM